MSDLLHMLLGCEHGHGRIAHQNDKEPCQEKAVQYVVIYENGAPIGMFKLCEKHRALVESESDPHEQ